MTQKHFYRSATPCSKNVRRLLGFYRASSYAKQLS